MELLDVFEVLANSDTTEGKGHDRVIGRFFTKVEATRFAKGKCVMGTDGRVVEGCVLAIPVDGFKKTYHPVGPSVPVFGTVQDKIRLEALAKLTPEERRVLGLISLEPNTLRV